MEVIDSAAFVCLGASLLLGAYHYLLYPAAVVAASRLLRRRQKPNEDLPRVTLAIAAYNEESVIADKVRNSLALDYPNLEIMVVADGSDDGTAERVMPFRDAGIVLMHETARRGKAAALNRAVSAASGDIIVFSDANAMYQRDAVRELVRGFSDRSVGAVSGCKLVHPRGTSGDGDAGFGTSESLYWRYENLIRMAESRLGSTVATVGEMFAIRRAAFRPIPAGVVNDDAWLTLDLLRRGMDVRYAPSARTAELASLSTTDERIRRRRIAAGRWLLLSDFRLWPVSRPWVLLALLSHKLLRLGMPFALATALVSNVVLAARGAGGNLTWILLLAQLAFYCGSLVGRNETSGGGTLRRLSRICYFIVASNISVAFGFMDWIRKRQNVLWAKAAR